MSAETLITGNLDLWTGAITKKVTSGRGSNKKIELTGIHKLRHLILELACHGKLVPQLSSDIPAHEALEGLRQRRKELIRKKKIKNSKPLPNVSAEEEPSKLPSNWVWTRLGSIAEINPRNNAEDGTEASFVPMPLITTSYHGDHGHETKPWGKIKKGYTHFADGDLALAKITPCFENSKAAVFKGLINGIGAGTTELHVARPLNNSVNPYYLILFLKSPRFLIEGEKVMTGSAGQKRVPKDYFSSTPLPLPPTEEQHRIVQKVDELMVLCDRLEQKTSDQIAAHDTLVDTLLGTLTQSQNATELAENWTRLAAHFDTLFTTEQSIDKLKQTTLQLAVMGRLVEQDARGESTHELFDRVYSEDNNRRSRQQDKSQIACDSHLPSGWAYAVLPEVTKETKYSLKRGPFGSALKKAFFKTSGFKVYEQQHAINNDFSRGDYYIDEDKFAELKAFEVKPGDLIISCSGTVGRVAEAPTWMEPGVINQALLKLSLDQRLLSNDYFKILFPAFFLETDTLQNLQGTAQKNMVSMDTLKKEAFPMPPIKEQQRIVQKVDEIIALCDQLKERLNQASETRCQLAESIVESALQ
ncbi:MAG: restriction endonuclease subunit S [Alcanivorax sp.]|uniref:restriction endonuclease subunit S n=1 Tax=Alcanivorax sp. TaxID=1872427 RepID=UPI003C6A20DD